MNAYELADKLENEINLSENLFVFDAADMLRQQADRITELEKAPTKYCPSENNAAYEKGFIDGMAKQRDSAVQRMVEANTHPHKELSDEEIEVIVKEWFNCHPEESLTSEFAIPLYSVVNLCKQLLKHQGVKNERI